MPDNAANFSFGSLGRTLADLALEFLPFSGHSCFVLKAAKRHRKREAAEFNGF